MVDIQFASAEIRRGKKKKIEEETTGQKYNGLPYIHRAAKTRIWADAQRDGRSAEYRWRPLQKFRNSIPCTSPQFG